MAPGGAVRASVVFVSGCSPTPGGARGRAKPFAVAGVSAEAAAAPPRQTADGLQPVGDPRSA
ncbi:MAG: hypothetical protein ACPIOQ_00195 [Promethearchaeia archaeon]